MQHYEYPYQKKKNMTYIGLGWRLQKTLQLQVDVSTLKSPDGAEGDLSLDT